MEQLTILAVDDEMTSLSLLKEDFEAWGYKGFFVNRAAKALEILQKHPVDLIISDQVMPDMGGIELLHKVKEKYNIPFIILTAFGSIDTAVQCIKEGAYDYILKPYSPADFKLTIERCIDHHRLQKENSELRSYMTSLYGFEKIIHQSKQMAEAIQLAEKVAKSPYTPVCIYGEGGTGRQLLARAIHTASGGLENKFFRINCAGVPTNILESELFGYVKGAFPGADQEKNGKFSYAQGGTILLDEIGDISLDLQAKLLRTLEQRYYEKLGSDKQLPVNFRLIATTHRNLAKLVEKEKFREDFYHIINAFPIYLPPLRERKEDIPLLVDHFMNMFRMELGKPVPSVSNEAMELLTNYYWPGNVRELKNCLERAAIILDKEVIKPKHLILKKGELKQFNIANSEGKIRLEIELAPEEFSMNSVINRTLQIVLEKCNHNKVKAAEMLRINRNMFYRRKFYQ